MTEHATSSIELVQQHSLPSLILSRIERLILSGKLTPGSQLTEIPLAAQFGVSRGPVREAFRGLAEKGLVRIEKNRGVFVRTITTAEADDIYEVRLPLEKIIVTRLARTPERLANSGLTELLARTQKLADKGDFAKCHDYNLEFHDRLAVLTGNAALVDAYRRLVSELSLFRHQAHARIPDASSLRASVADHQAILEAIVSGNGRLATRLIGAHVEDSRRRTRIYLATAKAAPRSFSPSTRSKT